jgi:MFS family permease
MVDLRLLTMFGLGVIGNMTQSVLSPFFSALAYSKGVDSKFIGMIFGLQPFIAGLSSPFYGSVLARLGRKKVLLFSVTLIVINT